MKRSFGFWFWLSLTTPGNLVIVAGAILVTIIFVQGAITHKEPWLGIVGVSAFAGYIYTRIRATKVYKAKVDKWIDKGLVETDAIDRANAEYNT